MNKTKVKLGYLLAAAGMSLGLMAPLIAEGTAFATGSGGLVTSRSIQMSSANPGAASVNYLLTFTPKTTEPNTGDGIVIDFCNNSPIIGSACNYDTGTTVPDITSSTTASVGTISVLNSHTIQLTDVTLTAGTPFSVTFSGASGIANPTTAASYYARITTYASATTGYTAESATGGTATLGSYVDYGGDALSTDDAINVSATVQETLTFCVSGVTLLNTTCSSSTAPSITLGSGTPPTLGTASASTGAAYTQLSTNATSGANVYMKAANTCDGLSSNGGSSCAIPGVGAFAAAPGAGTAFFGLNVGTSTNNTTGGSGAVTPNANYGSTAGDYGMGTNVTTTYGDAIASSGSPCAFSNNTLTFAAQAANTTPAGVYTASESLIATGVF